MYPKTHTLIIFLNFYLFFFLGYKFSIALFCTQHQYSLEFSAVVNNAPGFFVCVPRSQCQMVQSEKCCGDRDRNITYKFHFFVLISFWYVHIYQFYIRTYKCSHKFITIYKLPILLLCAYCLEKPILPHHFLQSSLLFGSFDLGCCPSSQSC